MDKVRRPWLRGALTLGVLATFGAAALISNAGAVAEKKEASKKFVKQRINKAAAALETADAQTSGRVGYGAVTALQVPNTAGGFVALATATVTAPAPGFLILHGTSDTYNVFGFEIVLCDLTLNGTRVPASLHFTEIDTNTGQDPDSNGDDEELFSVNTEEDCATHAVAPVPAGTHTVAYRTDNALDDTSHENSVVSALFVPFGGSGAPPRSVNAEAGDEISYEEALARRGLDPPVRS